MEKRTGYLQSTLAVKREIENSQIIPFSIEEVNGLGVVWIMRVQSSHHCDDLLHVQMSPGNLLAAEAHPD